MSHKKKILILEPNKLHYELIKQNIAKLIPKYQITRCLDLQEATNLLNKNHQFQIVFSEYFESNESSHWIEKLKKQTKDTPLYILTTKKDETKAVESIKQGADDYLIKNRETLTRLNTIIKKATKKNRNQKSQLMPPTSKLQNISKNMKTILEVINDLSPIGPKAKKQLARLQNLEHEIENLKKTVMGFLG